MIVVAAVVVAALLSASGAGARARERLRLDPDLQVWQLRQNLTAYDAVYVALAEAVDAPLVTTDVRLSRAPGLNCPVEVLID